MYSKKYELNTLERLLEGDYANLGFTQNENAGVGELLLKAPGLIDLFGNTEVLDQESADKANMMFKNGRKKVELYHEKKDKYFSKDKNADEQRRLAFEEAVHLTNILEENSREIIKLNGIGDSRRAYAYKDLASVELFRYDLKQNFNESIEHADFLKNAYDDLIISFNKSKNIFEDSMKKQINRNILPSIYTVANRLLEETEKERIGDSLDVQAIRFKTSALMIDCLYNSSGYSNIDENKEQARLKEIFVGNFNKLYSNLRMSEGQKNDLLELSISFTEDLLEYSKKFPNNKKKKLYEELRVSLLHKECENYGINIEEHPKYKY